MNTTYTWTVQSVDAAAGTMIVSYKPTDGEALHLNLPQPPLGTSVSDHVALFAPTHQWAAILNQFEPVEPGHTGTNVHELVSSDPSEAPNTTGSWNEEYLRAMIYQVLEEIKEAQV